MEIESGEAPYSLKYRTTLPGGAPSGDSMGNVSIEQIDPKGGRDVSVRGISQNSYIIPLPGNGSITLLSVTDPKCEGIVESPDTCAIEIVDVPAITLSDPVPQGCILSLRRFSTIAHFESLFSCSLCQRNYPCCQPQFYWRISVDIHL